MALPFESAPATRLERSGLGRLGYQLSQQQKAEKQAERDRYEGMLEEVSGNVWSDRDGGVLGQSLNALMEMAVNPEYFNAPLGSDNHKKFIRAKKQYKDLAAMSVLNQKQFMEQQKFLQQQGADKVTGVDALKQYYSMGDVKGDVTIDDNGNFMLNGEPLITSGIFSTPPSLSKSVERANLEDIWGGTKMEQFQNSDGTYSMPSRDKAYTFLRNKFAGMGDKKKYLRTYITDAYVKQYGQQPAEGYVESVIENSGDAIYDAMLQDMTDIHLTQYKSGGKVSGSDGESVDSWGVDRGDFSGIAKEFDGAKGFAIAPVKYTSGATDKDSGEMYYISNVGVTDDRKLKIGGYKLVANMDKLAKRGFPSMEDAAEYAQNQSEMSGTPFMDILETFGVKTQRIQNQDVPADEEADVLSVVADKYSALEPIQNVSDMKDWIYDYGGGSVRQQKQEETKDVNQSSLPQGNVPLF